MATDTRTIGELQKDGFTHIDARCASCGRIVQMPFKLLLTRERITTATTIAELRRRYRCQNCGEFTRGSFRSVATRGQHGLRDRAGSGTVAARQSARKSREAPRLSLHAIFARQPQNPCTLRCRHAGHQST